MRNYKDLLVWDKAHKLTLAILPGYVRLSKERAIWFDQPDPPFVSLDCGKLGRRLWQKIRRRDGTFHSDFNGFRIGAFLSPATRARLGFLEECRIFQAEHRSGGGHENAVFAVAEDQKRIGGLEVSS